jgi:hypothetical protein
MEDLGYNDLNLLGEAIRQYVEQKERCNPDGSDWESKIHLLNGYLFDVPPWRLRPLYYDKKGMLQLGPDFLVRLGSTCSPVDEFYYFWKKYGRRQGTARRGHEDTLPVAGISVKGLRRLSEYHEMFVQPPGQ